ncbi:MAG: tetratricopeptide repeat protein, partial [Candidatus Hydrogenedentota bacterium]
CMEMFGTDRKAGRFSTQKDGRKPMRKIWPAISILLIAGMLYGLTIAGCASTEPPPTGSKPEVRPALALREPIVLVCPITSMTPEQEISDLSLILAPLIRRDLFCVQQISVVPTEDTNVPGKPFFLTESGLRKLGLVHGADIVTVGILRGNSASVSIELDAYDLKNDYCLLKTKVEGKTSKIFKLQRELVYEFIDALDITLSKEERHRLTFSSPKKFQAASEYGRGLKSEKNEKYTEALIAYENAVQADRRIAVPYAAEARVYSKYNAPLRAMESYENAVARDKFFAEAWYQLNLYAAQYRQRHDAAMEYCEQALEIAPRFGKARLSLGVRLYALGQLGEAIEETKTAVTLLPVAPLPRYNLGVYYLEANDPREARKWFGQALELDPGFELARSELQKLVDK